MIIRKSKREIDIMSKANSIVAETHEFLSEKIEPGISTYDLDKLAEEFIENKGGKPSFKGYRGYPASVCLSINDEVVHGIPSKTRVLEKGMILSVDIGVYYKGFHGDAARTFPVGKISQEAKSLIEVTRKALDKGIENAIIGNRLTDISNAVQIHVENAGCSVVRDYVGHGIGTDMHEDPQIPNFGPAGRGPRLKEGMTLAIEPMVNIGHYNVKTKDDGWTVVTEDGSLSAHWEDSIAITKEGPKILSRL
ncbi:type I methionyl aminopeptidase [Halanaerobiaceae bacterium Z-7014]|uniref:Methionine aminopeptidase n=1 Tax=Halonatronomonas betaini TaxID=2778430 RepID=A0A931AS69_9FIRM|nr:type I methionyl aminopeptidase [Halonatronomonas betaini]MBF8438033.1 type I methionyl aminopeptidase [Halonatronomonas betaini]